MRGPVDELVVRVPVAGGMAVVDRLKHAGADAEVAGDEEDVHLLKSSVRREDRRQAGKQAGR
eukprot:92345-Hanusia_phi.AAC.1